VDFLKVAARRLGVGLVYGIGFAVGLWLTFLGLSQVRLAGEPSIARSPIETVVTRAAALEIVSSEAVVRPYLINIIGTVRNAGTIPVSHTTIVADLFDKDGKFYFQCKGWLNDTIAPSVTMTFGIDCHGVSKGLWERYGSYSVRVSA